MAGPGQDTPEQNNPSDETREGIKPAPVAADKTKLLEPYLQQQLGNSNGQNNPFSSGSKSETGASPGAGTSRQETGISRPETNTSPEAGTNRPGTTSNQTDTVVTLEHETVNLAYQDAQVLTDQLQSLSLNQGMATLQKVRQDLRERGYNPSVRLLGYGTEANNPNSPLVNPDDLWQPNQRMLDFVANRHVREQASRELTFTNIFDEVRQQQTNPFSHLTDGRRELRLTMPSAREEALSLGLTPATDEQQSQYERRLIMDQALRRDPNLRDPFTLQVRVKNDLIPAQQRLYANQEELQHILRVGDVVADRTRALQSEYERNHWQEDSHWFGLDDGKFLAEVASRNPYNVSDYDKFRVLAVIERTRRDSPQIFIASNESKLTPQQRTIRDDISKQEHDTRKQLIDRLRHEVTRLEIGLGNEQGKEGLVLGAVDGVIGNIGKPGGWGGMFMDSDATSRATRENIEKARQASERLLALSEFKGDNIEFAKAYQERTTALLENIVQVNVNLSKMAEAHHDRIEGFSDITQITAATAAMLACAAAAPETFGGSLAAIPIVAPMAAGAAGKLIPKLLESETSATGFRYRGPDIAKDALVSSITSFPLLPGSKIAKPLLQAEASVVEKATIAEGAQLALRGSEQLALRTGEQSLVRQSVSRSLAQGLRELTPAKASALVLKTSLTAGKRAVGYSSAGAIDGAIVSSTRAAVSGEDPFKAGVQGLVAGALLGPVFGPAFRLLGEQAKRLGNRLRTLNSAGTTGGVGDPPSGPSGGSGRTIRVDAPGSAPAAPHIVTPPEQIVSGAPSSTSPPGRGIRIDGARPGVPEPHIGNPGEPVLQPVASPAHPPHRLGAGAGRSGYQQRVSPDIDSGISSSDQSASNPPSRGRSTTPDMSDGNLPTAEAAKGGKKGPGSSGGKGEENPPAGDKPGTPRKESRSRPAAEEGKKAGKPTEEKPALPKKPGAKPPAEEGKKAGKPAEEKPAATEKAKAKPPEGKAREADKAGAREKPATAKRSEAKPAAAKAKEAGKPAESQPARGTRRGADPSRASVQEARAEEPGANVVRPAAVAPQSAGGPVSESVPATAQAGTTTGVETAESGTASVQAEGAQGMDVAGRQPDASGAPVVETSGQAPLAPTQDRTRPTLEQGGETLSPQPIIVQPSVVAGTTGTVLRAPTAGPKVTLLAAPTTPGQEATTVVATEGGVQEVGRLAAPTAGPDAAPPPDTSSAAVPDAELGALVGGVSTAEPTTEPLTAPRTPAEAPGTRTEPLEPAPRPEGTRGAVAGKSTRTELMRILDVSEATQARLDRSQELTQSRLVRALQETPGHTGKSLAEEDWEFVASEAYSPADLSHIDGALVNKKEGLYIIVDISDNAIIDATTLPFGTKVDAKFGEKIVYSALHLASIARSQDVARSASGEVERLIYGGVSLSLREHPLPPMKVLPTIAETHAAVRKYQDSLMRSIDPAIKGYGRDLDRTVTRLRQNMVDSTATSARDNALSTFKESGAEQTATSNFRTKTEEAVRSLIREQIKARFAVAMRLATGSGPTPSTAPPSTGSTPVRGTTAHFVRSTGNGEFTLTTTNGLEITSGVRPARIREIIGNEWARVLTEVPKGQEYVFKRIGATTVDEIEAYVMRPETLANAARSMNARSIKELLGKDFKDPLGK